MEITNPLNSSLIQLYNIVKQINHEDYNLKLDILNFQTIGKHVRHILEFYLQITNCKDNLISYDNRQRNTFIEENKDFALTIIKNIILEINLIDFNKPIVLKQEINNKTFDVKSSFGREIIYCIDHSIHHFALLKLALVNNFNYVKVEEEFGYNYSTLKTLKDN